MKESLPELGQPSSQPSRPPSGTPPGTPSGTEAYQALDRVLGLARRRAIGLQILRATGLALGAAGSAALLGGLALGTHPSPLLRYAILGLIAAGLAAPAIWAALEIPRNTAARLALRIAGPNSRLRSLLLSAVELRRLGGETRGLSTMLIEAQASSAADQVKAVKLDAALPALASWTAMALGALVALSAVVAWRFGPPLLVLGIGSLYRLPAQAHPKPTAEPITGDIELTYSYPAHTRLVQRTVAGTSGEIEAPEGTQVSLRTRADRPVKQAELVVNGASQALAVSGDRLLAGSFVVSKPGAYFFRFGPASHPVAEGPPIAIAVQADAAPRVTLQTPAEELEVEPQQILDLRYQASDDYGLREIRLVYRLPGAEKETSQVLRKLADPPAHLEGSARFDLGLLHLMAGDELSYALEALDNDDVQGPKAGRSRPHHLKVFSPAEHHREALARVRTLWERLLSLLGDRLDEVSGPRSPSGGAADARAFMLCQDLEHEARTLLGDRNQEKGIANALLNVAHGERRRASATSDERAFEEGSSHATAVTNTKRRALGEEVEGLERDVLYIEALLDQATSDDLSALARELSVRRRELSELLERYRKNPTPELKEQVLAQFNRLKARSAELASRMQQLAKGLSNQPHLNLEALPKGFGSNLSQVEQALASSDIDQALKALDQLAGQLDRLQSELASSRGGESQQNRELARKLDDFKHDLDDVQRNENKIAGDTENIRREARKAQEQKSPASGALLEELRAETKRARGQLDQVPETAVARGFSSDDALLEAKNRTDELDRALEAKDLDQALHSAERALHSVGTLQGELDRDGIFRSLAGRFVPEAANPDTAKARSHLQQASSPLESVRDKLQKLFPDEKSLLGPQQREQLGKLQHEQERNQERAQQLSQKMDQIGKDAPIFDPAARDALRSATGKMQEAEQRLGQREPGQASEQERGAVDQLTRLSKAMGQSRGNGGGGVPNPFAMGQSGQGESDGAPESDHEKVVVPGADQYQVPAQFRRDILDAMKQKAPKSYEDEVKHYYQEIVK